MPTLIPGQPITVQTPELLVENQLALGQHRFQLVVIDEAGLESSPTELIVTVRRSTRPTGPFGPFGPLGPRGPEVVIPDIRVGTGGFRPPPRRPQ